LPPENCPNTSQKFSRIEWFPKIVVGADLQAYDTIYIFLESCQQNDRNLRSRPSKVPADIQAGGVGQQNVEHDETYLVAGKRFLECSLVRRKRYTQLLFGEIPAQQLSYFKVVVYD
jgi:hypothetical protein